MIRPWTLETVAEATGGRLVGDPQTPITDVAVDSRAVVPGVLFVALRGERFDGHRFTAEARRNGAVAVLVSVPEPEDEAAVVVPDTATALRDLAAHRRAELDVPVVAITGSTGKTTTKDLLAAALPGSTASLRSYNNEVGVPLTVLSAGFDTTVLIVEAGSRGTGHLRWLLPAIRPDVAVITNLGVVHLETFGTVERLADAKWELVEGLESGGVAVLPAGEPRLRRPHAGRTVTFGTEPEADVSVHDIVPGDDGRARFRLVTPAGERDIRLAIPGSHQPLNAAAAVAAGLALGADLDTLVAGIVQAEGSPWRMEIHRGSFTVVNDAYNANPDSVEAALRTVAAMPGRHVAVLGAMAELGPVEEEEHVRIGTLAADLGFATVVTVGDDPGIARGAGAITRPAADPAAALRLLDTLIEPGDVVLVKASRAIGLEGVAAMLRDEAGA